jgi:hypothetical protein
MCEPVTIATGIAIGAATGAAGAAITGQDVGRGALMGGIMGGVTAGFGGFDVTGSVAQHATKGATEVGFMANLGSGISMAQPLYSAWGSTMTVGGMVAAGTTGLLGSVAMGTLFPEPEPYDFAGYTPSDYGYSPIQYNTQHNTITGSGGRQASAVLASEIQRNRNNNDRSPSVSAVNYGLQNTGLQLA